MTSKFSGPQSCALTARQAVAMLKAGKVSPAELLQDSLVRISQVEPAVNAMPTICEGRAKDQLKSLDQLAQQYEHAPGWLAGLPMGIKDLNAVSGVRSTWATVGLKEFVPDVSHPLVEKLATNGGVIVGKTNTPEMGAGGNTFNDVFGMTRNPWDTRKNAGGSSGGAAVSLATGEVWLSHGSDLAGSLRTPAAYCGVVGLRPSPGRAGGGSEAAAFWDAPAQGPMARNVGDCALFLDAMAGFDPKMPLSLEAPAISFQEALEGDVGDIKIGFSPDLDGFAPVESEIRQVMAEALKQIEDGKVKVEKACPNLPELERTYITQRGIIYGAISAKQPQKVLKHFKKTLIENIAVGQALTTEDIFDYSRQRTVLYHKMRIFLEKYDVLTCAVVGLEPGPVEVEYPRSVDGVKTKDYVDWLKFSFLATTCGLPAMSLPCGFTKSGMPVGLQLIGPPRGEARLLQVAQVLEERWGLATKVPIDPKVRR